MRSHQQLPRQIPEWGLAFCFGTPSVPLRPKRLSAAIAWMWCFRSFP